MYKKPAVNNSRIEILSLKQKYKVLLEKVAAIGKKLPHILIAVSL